MRKRIAEVSARFALDAMPGKQMTIDADFNAGLISPDEAVKRREDLQRESSLFGSMDGAMKFVKGDTIAGIIITVINILGGLIIGVAMNQMPMADAVSKYTVLTIGDGLCAQVPSLLMSISCGIVMTRSTAAATSLGKDVFCSNFIKASEFIFRLCIFNVNCCNIANYRASLVAFRVIYHNYCRRRLLCSCKSRCTAAIRGSFDAVKAKYARPC